MRGASDKQEARAVFDLRLSDGKRLTRTQADLFDWIVKQTAEAGGAVASKAEMARMLECSDKTVDRAVSRLRREGLVEVKPRYDDNGAQLANMLHATLLVP